jgi:hypothetical protein
VRIEVLANQFGQEVIECRVESTLFFGRLPSMNDGSEGRGP